MDKVIKDGLKENGSGHLSSKFDHFLPNLFSLTLLQAFTALILLFPGHPGKKKDGEL